MARRFRYIGMSWLGRPRKAWRAQVPPPVGTNYRRRRAWAYRNTWGSRAERRWQRIDRKAQMGFQLKVQRVPPQIPGRVLRDQQETRRWRDEIEA